ncbi:MAG: helix-turn-helix domain-containing protein [Bacilli bacterium]|nr:helix-turn-helix domain-containing protein [Bacilli bacterium]
MNNKREYLIILYDYYGELLKEETKKFFEDYYFDNLSLGEIADNNNISRNAIHKHIKSAEEKLVFYEEKLKLYEKDKMIKEKISDIKDETIKKIIQGVIG